MFNGCSALTDVTFDAGFSMTSLPNSMFKACSSLKTIVIPNSVTELNGGTFYNCTSIEKVVLGANLAKMGSDEFACAGSGTKAVKLYAPASLFASLETIPSRVYTWDTNHMKNVTYYFTGTKAQAEAIISKAEFANIKNAKVVAWDVAKGENHADYVVPGSNVFVYGYNYCDAFYGGEHLTAEQTYDFTAFTEKSYLRSVCKRCEAGTVLKEIAPLFTCLGYSASEGTMGGGIALGFKVNSEAITEYEELTVKTIAYGVFAVSQLKLGTNNIFGENGEMTEGVLGSEIKTSHTVFEIKITGIPEDKADVKLALGAYVAETDGETTEYSYMQGGEPNENEKYCFVSYNDIIVKQPANAEVTQ